MSKPVNENDEGATIPPVVETEVPQDPFDMILSALEDEEPDTDQPTLETEVEEETEDQEEPAELEDEPIEEVEEDGQNEPDDEPIEEEEYEDEDLDEPDDEIDSVDDTIEDDDSEEETEDEWFYTGHHSEYKTPDAAKKGIEAKDAYIVDLEANNDELTKDIAALRQKVTMYTSTISEEAMEVAAVQSLLPEEYRGKSDADFEDDTELRKFWKAELEAKEAYRSKQVQAAEAARVEEERKAAASKEAAKFVRDTATTGFFGVRNPEERNELRKVLTEKDEMGYTPLDRARMITEVFGEVEGRRYLEGLRLEIQSEEDNEVSTTKSKKTKSSKKKVVAKNIPPKKVVQKVKRTKVKKKVPVTPPAKGTPTDKFVDADALDIISAGLS